MPAHFGRKKITEAYYGSRKIKEAYYGRQLVYTATVDVPDSGGGWDDSKPTFALRRSFLPGPKQQFRNELRNHGTSYSRVKEIPFNIDATAVNDIYSLLRVAHH